MEPQGRPWDPIPVGRRAVSTTVVGGPYVSDHRSRGSIACLIIVARRLVPSTTAGTPRPTDAAGGPPAARPDLRDPRPRDGDRRLVPRHRPAELRLAFTHLSGTGDGRLRHAAGRRPMSCDSGADAPGTHKHLDWSPDGRHVVFIDETSEHCRSQSGRSPSESVAACDAPGCDYPAWSPGRHEDRVQSLREQGWCDRPRSRRDLPVDLASGEVPPSSASSAPCWPTCRDGRPMGPRSCSAWTRWTMTPTRPVRRSRSSR